MSELFYQDPLAPSPTSLHMGVAVGIFRGGRLLLDHRRDGGWALFGGAMEVGESLEGCARREISEELGISVGVLDLVGIVSEPSRIIRFSNGTTVQSVTVAFCTEWKEGEFSLSTESRAAKWLSSEDLNMNWIAPTHRMIIPHLFDPKSWPVIL